MNLSKSIEVAAAMKGLKGGELAKSIDLAPSSLSVIKSRNSTSTDTLEKLSNACDMKVSEFIALGEDK